MPAGALSQAYLLIANQMLSRLLTFVLNLFVARRVGPRIFGLQAVNLYLLYTMVLFLSREPVRRAVMRFHGTRDPSSFESNEEKECASSRKSKEISAHTLQCVINGGWLSVVLSSFISALTLMIFLWTAPELPLQLAAHYRWSLYCYTVSTWLEMLAEPLYVLNAAKLGIQKRVRIEATCSLLRCLVTAFSCLGMQFGLLSFALGQMAFSGAYCLAYWLQSPQLPEQVHRMPRRLLPSTSQESIVASFLSPELWTWSRGFSLQVGQKLLLTEGEKIVLMAWVKDKCNH